MPDWEEMLARQQRELEEREREAAEEAAARRAAAEAEALRLRREKEQLAARARPLVSEVRKAIAALEATKSTGDREGLPLSREYEKRWYGDRFCGWRGRTESGAVVHISVDGRLTIRAGRDYSLEEAVREGKLQWTASHGGPSDRSSTSYSVEVHEVLTSTMALIASHIAALRRAP